MFESYDSECTLIMLKLVYWFYPVYDLNKFKAYIFHDRPCLLSKVILSVEVCCSAVTGCFCIEGA